MTLYLSRLQLRRDPSVVALNALLDPKDDGRRLDAHHRLLWTAFAGDPEARRDFLWRAEGEGVFLTLSPRAPAGAPLFDPPQVKAFAPDLRAGDRLAFALRANATRTEKTGALSAGGREKKRHIDLVMDALHPLKEGRAEARAAAAQAVAERWLAGQGERHGFSVDRVVAEHYRVAALPGQAGRRDRSPRYGLLDLTGVLIVRDPAALLSQITAGFGRAKAFGCGLMLIRRV